MIFTTCKKFLISSIFKKGFCTQTNSSTPRGIKVAVLGASGGIGQPLCLLLRHNPRVSQLALYDVQLAPGVAADLSHVPSKCSVKGYGPGQIRDALEGADIVLLSAGVPRKANQSREDQFNINAKIIKPLASTCSHMAPNAIYGIISNPVNSIVPLFCEMFQQAGVFDQYKIMGITLLDSVRAGTFIAKEKGWDPLEINCPVICGHSGATIVPVLSQCKPDPQLSNEKAKFITLRVKEAGREIVDAKQDTGTVTLSMAWSAHKFIDSVIRAMQGEKGIVECAYVKSDVCPEVKYFASEVELGPHGIVRNLGVPVLNAYEKSLMEEAVPKLATHIAAGEAYANMKVGWWP